MAGQKQARASDRSSRGGGSQGAAAAAKRGSAPKGGGAVRGGAAAGRGGRPGGQGARARPGDARRGRGAVRDRQITPGGDAVGGTSALSQPVPPGWLRLATLILAVCGLGVSIYLTVAHYTDAVLAGCSEHGGAINCGAVTTSPQSKVFGIPVAVLGLAFYIFMVAIMSPIAWRSSRREIRLARLLGVVTGIGFVLYLIYAEIFDIGAICLYCTSVHVITFVLFVLIALSEAVWGGTQDARRR